MKNWIWHVKVFLHFLYFPVDYSTIDQEIKWRIDPITAWKIARIICRD